VPVVTGVTTPEELTVATDVLLLIHVPPEGDPLSVVVEPRQTPVAPLIVTAGFTDTVRNAAQPEPIE